MDIHDWNPHFLQVRRYIIRCQFSTLQWRHNGCDGVSNHQPHYCLPNRLFWRRKNKHQSSASLAFVWGIHRWPMSSPQMASNAENVSIWWRHHGLTFLSTQYWNHKSIITIYNQYTDSYIWIIIHQKSSAVHESGFGVHIALVII